VDLRTIFGTSQINLGVSRANAIDAPKPSNSDYDPSLKRYTYSFKHQVQSESGFFGQLDAQGQWANRPLLNSERIGFGGGGIGRGFAPSSIVGDKGLGGSLELGWARRLTLPAQLDEGIGQIYIFKDHARAEKISAEGQVLTSEKIASRGLGFRWQSNTGSRTSIYFAKPDDVDGVVHAPTQKIYLNFAMPW